MNKNSAHIKKENGKLKIELSVAPSVLWSQLILFFLLLIPTVSIFIFLYQIIFNWTNKDMAWFLGLGLTTLVAWYFLRLLLWNRGGREIITIEENNITYYSDYRLFTLGRENYEFKEFSILYLNIDDDKGVDNSNEPTLLDDMIKEEGRGLLGFEFDNGRRLETSIDLPISELRKIINIIERN